MGKYDALFADDEEPSKKPKGKYAGLFDEPAPAAKPFPWETEAAPTGRLSKSERESCRSALL